MSRITHSFARTIVAAPGIVALVAAVGCGTQGATLASSPSVSPATAPQAQGTPIVVSCEPNQRTLVRPVIVNGAAVSQVECLTNTQPAVAAQQFVPAQPVAVADTYRAVRVAQPVSSTSDDLRDARVVSDAPARVVRPVQTREVYREPVRRTRSVKKSAIIIGSSAGAGAGVGAAIGGKKGALIGAVIGGGGATLWDQITRRDR